MYCVLQYMCLQQFLTLPILDQLQPSLLKTGYSDKELEEEKMKMKMSIDRK